MEFNQDRRKQELYVTGFGLDSLRAIAHAQSQIPDGAIPTNRTVHWFNPDIEQIEARVHYTPPQREI